MQWRICVEQRVFLSSSGSSVVGRGSWRSTKSLEGRFSFFRGKEICVLHMGVVREGCLPISLAFFPSLIAFYNNLFFPVLEIPSYQIVFNSGFGFHMWKNILEIQYWTLVFVLNDLNHGGFCVCASEKILRLLVLCGFFIFETERLLANWKYFSGAFDLLFPPNCRLGLRG